MFSRAHTMYVLLFVALTGCDDGGTSEDTGGFDFRPHDTGELSDSRIDVTPDGDDTTPADTLVLSDGDTTHEVSDTGPELTQQSCEAELHYCTSHASRRYCASTVDGYRWTEEACEMGHGCVNGECVFRACSDECRLGETDGTRTCQVYDVSAQQYLNPEEESLHDRARRYAMWLHRDGSFAGGVANARYADPPTYSQVESLDGVGDSAIWTGTYLAAESLRLLTTGAVDAQEAVSDLVSTLHLWLSVSGDPGYLARYVAPAGTHPLISMNCDDPFTHCNVDFEGSRYDWLGHISRDQYQGVMLGYGLAYRATHDETVRSLIRDDVVSLLQTLMQEHPVHARLHWDGTQVGAFDINLHYAVLSSADADSGTVDIYLDSQDWQKTEMRGFQEFLPDLAYITKQMNLPAWVDLFVPESIPRPGSAVMLASFFNVGLLVTDGVPGYEAVHEELEAYYYYHVDAEGTPDNVLTWLDVAAQWEYLGECGASYYANNIVMEPLYNLLQLEENNTVRAAFQAILANQMWDEFSHTKNVFFSYIYASCTPNAESSATSIAAEQLAQFPNPPRVRVPVSLLNEQQYLSRENGCENQLAHRMGVDVGDRVVSDFLWQRHPWGLVDTGDPAQTYPGVDYLIAYWMGRYHGFLDDPGAHRCAAWSE